MTLSYNRDIPDGPHNPSNDQPLMKINTNSIDDWTAVDHVRFRDAPVGTHLQSTYSSKNVAGAQIEPQSVVYTDNGLASSVASLYYRNQNSPLILSALKAFGVFTIPSSVGVVTPVALLNGYNATVTQLTLTFTITLTTNCTTGNDAVTFIRVSNVSPLTPFFDSFAGGVLTVGVNPNMVGKNLYFEVLQA